MYSMLIKHATMTLIYKLYSISLYIGLHIFFMFEKTTKANIKKKAIYLPYIL